MSLPFPSQPPPTTQTASQGEASPAPSSTSTPASCAYQGGVVALMVVTFYFLLIRPQQKQQKAQDSLLRSLRPGLHVRTRGGIRGEIIEDKGEELILRIADKVKVNVLRSHVATVIQSGESAQESKA